MTVRGKKEPGADAVAGRREGLLTNAVNTPQERSAAKRYIVKNVKDSQKASDVIEALGLSDD